MQSAPILSWAVGKNWEWVRTYINRKGWTIEPLAEENHSHVIWIDTQDASYELKWVGKTCMRITKHVEGYPPEDVTSGEIPDEVAEMIE